MQKKARAAGAGKQFGYARVSTTDQGLFVKRQALEAAGVGVIFEERASGTNRHGRNELQKVLRCERQLQGIALRVQELSSQGLGQPPLRANWVWPAARFTGY